MYSTKLAVTAALAAALLTTKAGEAGAYSRVYKDVQATQVYYRGVSLAAGQTMTWETTDLSTGADTVMHLWDYSTGEVAYDDDGGVGLASRMTFTNTTGSTRSYRLIVRAYAGYSQGTARLMQNGAVLVSTIPVGGVRITVDMGTGYEYETALAPDGTENPYLWALDSSRRLVAYDYSSGVGLDTRISGHSNVRYIVVSRYTTAGDGPVDLYVNDTGSDSDGDGLGALLEAALGTCDSTASTACTGVFNPQDTDHDGLSDSMEVFGISGSPSQHLPRWGADPRHKDVFVEIDYSDAFSTGPVIGSDIAAAQAYFDAGSAGDLQNPDGLPGVRLHVDIGVDPTDPADATLYGDWGGTNAVPDGTSYKTAPADHRAAIRNGVFHYALANPGNGGGQGYAPGDRLNWGVNVSNRYMKSFAHELGHNLNIHHHGSSQWGKVNCKPHYDSLMNYVSGSAFSQGTSSVTLNPSVVDESAGLGAGVSAGYLESGPYYRPVSAADEVDWDFSDTFTAGGWGSTRAPLTFASHVGCNALDQNTETLRTGALTASTPSIIRGPQDRLYAFYVGSDQRIYYRQGATGGASYEGSCPGGASIGDDCMTWSAEVQVPTSSQARGVTAVYYLGSVILAFRTQWDSVRVIRSNSYYTATGELTNWNSETWIGSHTLDEPEITTMYVDPGQFGGYSSVVGVFYRERATGEYRWYSQPYGGAAFTYRGQLLDDSGAVLSGALSPTLAPWPAHDSSHAAYGTNCGVLTDTSGEVRFYCYDKNSNRFEDLTASAFGSVTPPTITGKPGVVFHALRLWAGPAADETRGQFWFTAVQSTKNPDVWMSTTFDAATGPTSLGFSTQRRGKMGGYWTNLEPGTGVALYEDNVLYAMKGLWVRDLADGDELQFLPLADGSYFESLRDGSDFRIMERGICVGIAGAGYCGDAADSYWGL